jgi:hypothetical protein
MTLNTTIQYARGAVPKCKRASYCSSPPTLVEKRRSAGTVLRTTDTPNSRVRASGFLMSTAPINEGR